MAYLMERQLRSYARSYDIERQTRRFRKNSRAAARVSIFLSHSHRDRELVDGFIKYLATSGIEIYVDWRDSGMPAITNGETASAIKGQIRSNDLFVVLATINAMNSKWVPWEIGVADQLKGYSRMFIVPVRDDAGRFEGTEYLQIYQRMELSDSSTLRYFDPGNSTGVLTEGLLRGFARR